MHDEYLTEEQLKTLKGMLEEQLESLLSQSREELNELVETREVDADPLDLAVSESNRDFTLRLADRERRLVAKIRYSLERIQSNEYGACEACGEPITYGRLMARPVATQCIDCKTEAEQVERRKRVF
ncbi:MAG: RNA polymerase-binding protein DksA [Deltaproteobacteria bacterium]|nr:RNA polymerase-binding protein DksA [Deltaproteobacteria bacterium]MBW2254378.1 RNA polymerase-binding protein DksA [Deltaproteobacteria bacterium]